MRALKARSSWLLAVILALLCAQSCGWNNTMTFHSPSRRARIEIWQRRVLSDKGARFELINEGRRTVLETVDRDTIIQFVHVYWTPDESKVAVVVAGLMILHLAANVKTGSPLPFESIRQQVAKSITETYHVPAGEDPIQWAHSDGQDEFMKRHPEMFRPLKE